MLSAINKKAGTVRMTVPAKGGFEMRVLEPAPKEMLDGRI